MYAVSIVRINIFLCVYVYMYSCIHIYLYPDDKQHTYTYAYVHTRGENVYMCVFMAQSLHQNGSLASTEEPFKCLQEEALTQTHKLAHTQDGEGGGLKKPRCEKKISCIEAEKVGAEFRERSLQNIWRLVVPTQLA